MKKMPYIIYNTSQTQIGKTVFPWIPWALFLCIIGEKQWIWQSHSTAGIRRNTFSGVRGICIMTSKLSFLLH